MKFTGAALIWIAFMLMGMKVAVLLKKREKYLSDTMLLLKRISGEIQYSRKHISEIIRIVASEEAFTEMTFLKKCSQAVSDGSDFPEAWRTALNEGTLYKREEKSKMLQLGEFLGTTDWENQVNTISLYSTYFEKFLSDAESDYDKTGRASSLFGVFIGAAAFIILY